MRIAQIMLAKQFGGAERSFVDISSALAARGHEVLAICHRAGAARAELAASGATVVPIQCRASWDVLAERAIRRELKRFQPQLVQCHLARAAHLGGRAARSLELPTLAKTHNLVNLKYYRAIDQLVPTTQAQAQYLRDGGIDDARITIIPNFTALTTPGISSQTARSSTEQSKSRSNPDQPFRIVALGRFVHKKGFDLLIDAAAALARSGVSFNLEIAGDGAERAALADRISSRQLSDCVTLKPWVTDIAAFLEGADLMVVPSRDEPFGIVLLEAMACRVPVLSSATQGPLEILTADTGYQCAVGDVDALCDAMTAALNDSDRDQKIERAYQRCLDQYSIDAVVSAYEALYQRMVSAT